MTNRLLPTILTTLLVLSFSQTASAQDSSKSSNDSLDRQSSIDTSRSAVRHRQAIRYHRQRSGIKKLNPRDHFEYLEYEVHAPEYLQEVERDKAEAEIEDLGIEKSDDPVEDAEETEESE